MSLRKAPFSLTHLLLLSTMAGILCVPSTGDDASCLKGLKASIQDAGSRLSKWTTTDLAVPCSSPIASNLDGIGCSSSRVVSIILNVSNLAGSISPSIADCTNLQTLDLSSNNLAGPVPTAVGNLTYLTRFNLSNNHLSGPIPVELSTCSFLNDIDLHDNELSGPIPGQLGVLTRLRVFDVSDNRLSGAIPTSLSNTTTGGPRFNVSSFRGNKDLYGYPLPPPSSHGLSVLAIVGIGLGSGLLSLIVSFTAVCIWLRVSEQGYAAQEGKISQLMSET